MRILICTAHPDDCEFGMGGSLARIVEGSHDVRVHVFSNSSTIEGNEGIRDEVVASIHGVYNLDLVVHKYPTMHFREHYQEIRDDIFGLKQKFIPDVVYTKSPNSLHPDHQVIGEACSSIFLESTIYGIEGVRDGHNQKVNKWVKLDQTHMAVKQQALACYKTQNTRHYSDFTIVESWNRFRGSQVGAQYAEAFEVIREVS